MSVHRSAAGRLGIVVPATSLAIVICVAAVLVPSAAPVAPVVATAGVAALLALIAWRDLVTFTIPDGAVLGLAVLALALRLAAPGSPADYLAAVAVDVTVTGGGFWLLREIGYRRRGTDILGFGDVKLAAALGVLVGTAGFSAALLAASGAGLAIAALAALSGRPVDRTTKLPFGALLAPAALVVWLAADGALGFGAA